MTDIELRDRLVTLLAADTNEPLASMSVQAGDQIGDETAEGVVTVVLEDCDTHAFAVGLQYEDRVPFLIQGVIPWADTATSDANAGHLARHITNVLLANQQVAPTDDATDLTTTCLRDPIKRAYGYVGEGDKQRRAVQVKVVYYKTPG